MPRAPTLLKSAWLGLVSLLLGPFALWFILNGKLRRRGILPDHLTRFLILAASFLAYNAFLFFAPMPWWALLSLHVGAGLVTALDFSRSDRSRYFSLPTDAFGSTRPTGSFADALLSVSMAVLPLAYLLSLVQQIGELGDFSIRLPSDVYTRSFLGMIYAVPVALILAWGAWRASYRPGIRTLVFFYAAVAVILAWVMVWERVDQSMAAAFEVGDREPRFFGYEGERIWRSAVKWIFYGSAFVLGIGYLLGAARTSAFLKRALVLCLPSLLLYVNMLFALGDWNLYLGAFRDGAYSLHHYGAYRLAVQSELLRTPSAFRAPALREEWADLEYRSGRVEKAKRLMTRIAADGRAHAYHADLGRRADSSLTHLARPHGEPLLLELPVVQPASYLDREWYALLGAVAFLKPEWTDLDLRKKLLDLSTTVQLNLPRLDNLPELAPAFRALGIPISPCFLDKERAVAALRQGRIPFLSLHGRWAPLSGYDPGRDGFYYWSYRDQGGSSGLFKNEDMDLFQHREGVRFGGRGGDAFRGTAKPEPRHSLQKFIPSDELFRHLTDIGGVAVVLGDSGFAGPAERKAAFLVEQGDVHYQDHENFEEAASCYRQAAVIFPHDQVHSRMLYLERRYREAASDPRDYRNLFKEYPPRWMGETALPEAERAALIGRILDGELGAYILLNWHSNPPPDGAPGAEAILDTALRIFSTLHDREPEEPLYIDSLASLRLRAGELAAAESLYARLAEFQPGGRDYANYRLAWVRFKRGELQGLGDLLDACEDYAEEARHLTMRGAVEMARGREGKAFAALSRSLKLDKGMGETHALLADYHKKRGDARAEAVHRLWVKRSS